MDFEITILSIFRQSASYLQRYFSQVERAFAQTGGAGHAIWLEGDSEDETYKFLQEKKVDLENAGHKVTLIKYDLKKPMYSSVDLPERWYTLASCWNKCLSHLEPSKLCICVESDLIWSPDILPKLARKLDENHHIIAPMLMTENSLETFGEYLYHDIWGCRRGASKFRGTNPFWKKCSELSEEKELVEVTTAGGMLMGTYDHMSKAKWNLTNCILNYAEGTKVFVDKTLMILHPEPEIYKNIPKLELALRRKKNRLDNLRARLSGFRKVSQKSLHFAKKNSFSE